MKRKLFLLSLCLLAGMHPWLASANEAKLSPASDLGKALQSLAGLQGFTCQFRQVLSYNDGGSRVYSGDLIVLRPGKFRWQYIKPYVQLYVGNGDKIWLYEPDLMQVQYLRDLGEVEPVVLQLLDGRVGLSDVLVLRHVQVADDVSRWQVTLGKGAQLVTVELGVEDDTLAWIESVDVLGNGNRLYLLNIQTQLPSHELFELNVPEGVDVIGA